MIERPAALHERLGEPVHRAEHRGERREGGETHCGGNHVVGALSHVDVIVGVHRRVGAALGPEQLVGPVGEHFVTVHVVAGAGARLIHIDHELIAVLPAQDLVGCLDDGVGQAGVESPGFLVGQGGGALDPDHRIDEGRKRLESRDRKVFDRANGLDAVEGFARHRLLAEGIPFDACSH